MQRLDKDTVCMKDARGYDSLFISAQTGNEAAVQALLFQYRDYIQPAALQGKKKDPCSAIDVGKNRAF